MQEEIDEVSDVRIMTWKSIS